MLTLVIPLMCPVPGVLRQKGEGRKFGGHSRHIYPLAPDWGTWKRCSRAFRPIRGRVIWWKRAGDLISTRKPFLSPVCPFILQGRGKTSLAHQPPPLLDFSHSLSSLSFQKQFATPTTPRCVIPEPVACSYPPRCQGTFAYSPGVAFGPHEAYFLAYVM